MTTIIDRRGNYTLEMSDIDNRLVWSVCYDGLECYRSLSFERARSHYSAVSM